MPQLVHIRVANPRRSQKKAKEFTRAQRPKKCTRKNPLLGGGELALMGNPKTKKRQRQANPFGFGKTKKKARRSRRRNPYGFASRRRSNSRRNPSIVEGYSVTDLAKIGVAAAAGGYGTRALTQLVLSNNNTGWVGYLANGAAALMLGWAGGKFLGKDVGVGIVAGGLSATAIRIWTEQVSQTSPSQLSGLGDLDFSNNGMGDYIQTGFPVPTISVKNAQGQYVVQAPPYNVATMPAALPAPAASAKASVTAAGAKSMGRFPAGRLKSRFAA